MNETSLVHRNEMRPTVTKRWEKGEGGLVAGGGGGGTITSTQREYDPQL